MSELRRTEPLRIGFVTAGLYGGGAERSLLSIIDALDRDRFAASLVLFDGRTAHAPPENVPLFVLPARMPTSGGRLVSRALQLAALARRLRFDLLVSFLMGPNVVAIAAGRLAGVPVVAGERSAPQTVLSDVNTELRHRPFWSAAVRLSYPRATRIVTNTDGARRELAAFLRVSDPGRIVTIPNPIDLDRIERLSAEPLDREWPAAPVLVHVARFTVAKDHDTLLAAFAAVRRNRVATLVLVGDGEDEARVRARTTALGLDGDVVFTGFTRNPYKYLARATISVLTSRFEGLPNAIIESLALGVPVVSTACQYGPVELLGDGACGVLTPVGDAQAFARAIDALLDDPARQRELAECGRRRAREFDRRRIGPRYEALFLEASGRQAGVTAAPPDPAPSPRIRPARG